MTETEYALKALQRELERDKLEIEVLIRERDEWRDKKLGAVRHDLREEINRLREQLAEAQDLIEIVANSKADTHRDNVYRAREFLAKLENK